MRRVVLFLALLGCSLVSKGQLSSTDSIFFQSIFTNQRYVDDGIMPGNWYHWPSQDSVAQLYQTMNSVFRFSAPQLDSIHQMTVSDTLVLDTLVNNSMAQYPLNYPQQDQMVLLPFQFAGDSMHAFGFRFPDTTNSHCRSAFLLIPGTGMNESYAIVNNWGYHNMLCYVMNNCRKFGDVFTFIKPNEESRAIFWNANKLNEYVVSYQIAQGKRYGINYIVEMIAWLKYLRKTYDKVFLLGLSEGGYSAFLASFYEEPDAALIAGGYSILFDSAWVEKDILRTRFDYLVDTFDRYHVRSRLDHSTTNYMFTYGANDPVIGMTEEHNFHRTDSFLNGLTNCGFYYNFTDHTFPPCWVIDSFIQTNLITPSVQFVLNDTLNSDTLITTVKFCRSGNYSFDLYKNNQWLQSFTQIQDSVQILLTDSGMYSIRQIMDSNLYSGYCRDSIHFKKLPVVVNSVGAIEAIEVQLVNPFHDELKIDFREYLSRIHQLYITDATGKLLYQLIPQNRLQTIPTASWAAGIYYLMLYHDAGSRCIKLIKPVN